MKIKKGAYLYETHLHTFPVSKCAISTVRENLEFYKSLGYAGVFITNHFIDGNINIDRSLPYEERIKFFFSDYKEGVIIGREIGIDVFPGAEISYKGTDFLVYGLSEEWFLSHPEIEVMKRRDLLAFLIEEGALVIHAHPYREAAYIDHIRLFPKQTQGVEIYNANRTEHENAMAKHYAKSYGFISFAGSDNHSGKKQMRLGGMQTKTRIKDEFDFIEQVRDGKATPFSTVATISDI